MVKVNNRFDQTSPASSGIYSLAMLLSMSFMQLSCQSRRNWLTIKK